MSLDGDCETNGSLRIEGTIRGNVRAAKSVVIGKNGLVDGSIFTQDAVISGQVLGSVTAESRLELHSTSHISGEIYTLRLQVDDGASLQGQVSVGEVPKGAKQPAAPAKKPPSGSEAEPAEEKNDSQEKSDAEEKNDAQGKDDAQGKKDSQGGAQGEARYGGSR
jgi:cytoskeletal protein CcmA (bactofilin family)